MSKRRSSISSGQRAHIFLTILRCRFILSRVITCRPNQSSSPPIEAPAAQQVALEHRQVVYHRQKLQDVRRPAGQFCVAVISTFVQHRVLPALAVWQHQDSSDGEVSRVYRERVKEA